MAFPTGFYITDLTIEAIGPLAPPVVWTDGVVADFPVFETIAQTIRAPLHWTCVVVFPGLTGYAVSSSVIIIDFPSLTASGTMFSSPHCDADASFPVFITNSQLSSQAIVGFSAFSTDSFAWGVTDWHVDISFPPLIVDGVGAFDTKWNVRFSFPLFKTHTSKYSTQTIWEDALCTLKSFRIPKPNGIVVSAFGSVAFSASVVFPQMDCFAESFKFNASMVFPSVNMATVESFTIFPAISILSSAHMDVSNLNTTFPPITTCAASGWLVSTAFPPVIRNGTFFVGYAEFSGLKINTPGYLLEYFFTVADIDFPIFEVTGQTNTVVMGDLDLPCFAVEASSEYLVPSFIEPEIETDFEPVVVIEDDEIHYTVVQNENTTVYDGARYARGTRR